MNKKRLDEIQYVRAFAILGVLSVHGTSTGLGGTPHDSVMFFIYNFLNIAGKLGTPTFIFLSSFVLFYTYYSKPLNGALLKRFFSQRLAYILVPYVVFSLLYWFVKGMIYGLGDWESEFKRLMLLLATGKAHTHLYFVFISVQFYIMFPIIMYLFKKFQFIRKYAIVHGIIIQWLWVCLNSKYFQIEMKGSVAFSYIMYYFIGAFFGIYYFKIIEWTKDWKKSFAFISSIFIGYGFMVCFYVGVMYLLRTNLVPFTNIWVEFSWSTQALFAGMVVLFLSQYVDVVFPEKLKNFLGGLGGVSFGIYLIHPFVLMVTRQILSTGEPAIFHGWQLISFLLALFGSWGIVRFFYNYVPYSWVFFGKGASAKVIKK